METYLGVERSILNILPKCMFKVDEVDELHDKNH